MLSRCMIDRNHKWIIYCFFAYLDIGWGTRVIGTALNASWDDGYVLSYGQVWIPLCAFYHRIPIEYPPV